jgi:lysozyme
MICNDLGIALIKKYESCRLQAYLDAVGIPTIGWGHTGPEVHLGLVWTQQQADDAFLQDLLHRAEMPLNSMLAGFDLSDNQYSALCSLVYNIGSGAFRGSTILADIHSGNLDDVPAQFLRWDKAGGVVLAGLAARRQAESDLWCLS